MILDNQKIIQALESKGATRPCARCGGKAFSISSGHSNFMINEDYKNIVDVNLTGLNIPVVFTICANCGAITPHAIFALFDKNSIQLKEESKDGE